mmetsp:Transcript_28442/g.80059  ORF Transcript_28442/g.80059 Transcript_28442/m.80059 type:complete len:454 (-) Transcript_28442:148-1509(-)
MAEVILVDGHGIQDFGIDGFVFDIDEIHLFADALHGGFGTQGSDVGSDESVRLTGNGLWIDIFVELHVTGVDAEDLETAVLIRHSDVDFSVEASETTEGRIDGIWTIGGSDDDDAGTLLQPIHQGQHLTDDTTLHFSVGLFTLWCNGIDLVDEDDGRSVLLGLLECLAEVGLTLTGHLGHDLRSIDEEKEGARLVGNGPRNEGLSASRWPVQEHTTWRFDSQGFEQGRVTQRELDHFTNLGHLLSATADIVVPHVVHLFFVFALDRLSLAVDDGVRGHDAVRGGVRLHDLEFHGVHGGSHQEEVALLDGTVGLEEVGFEVHVKEVSSHALDGVVQREDVHALSVRHVPAGGDGHDIRQAHAEVLAHDLVHSDAGAVAGLIGQHDADGVAALLSLDEHGVSAEELELLHLGGRQADHGVVVVGGVVHDQPVGAALLALRAGQDRVLHVCVFLVV